MKTKVLFWFRWSFVVLGMLSAGGISAQKDKPVKPIEAPAKAKELVEEMTFTGANYRDIPDVCMRGSKTIMFWFNSDVSSGDVDERFEFFDWVSRGHVIRCYFLGEHRCIVFVWQGPPGWRGAMGKVRFRAGKWVHVAGTFDTKDNEIRLYINGKLRVDEDLTKGRDVSVPIDAPPATLRIGAQLADKNHFKGKIKGFQILNRALTADEILEEYRKVYKDDPSPFEPIPSFRTVTTLKRFEPYVTEKADNIICGNKSCEFVIDKKNGTIISFAIKKDVHSIDLLSGDRAYLIIEDKTNKKTILINQKTSGH